MHTIIPAMVCRNDRPVFSFGVMGGHFQPVGQVHVLENMLGFGQDPQAALDCPRLFYKAGIARAETGLPEQIFADLAKLGHVMERSAAPLGGGQVVAIDWERDCLIAGSDRRKDGCALAC
jgi:gamma-glutamyltranspeptidase/glutathione hydrolase